MIIEIATCAVVSVSATGRTRACSEPQVAVVDVPMQRGETVELALCAAHLAELHGSADLVHTARKWLR